MASIPLMPGNYYHIYNRDNNHDDIFYENDNYFHFLRLHEKYINPVADTFAWCLLKNHYYERTFFSMPILLGTNFGTSRSFSRTSEIY